MSAIPVIAVFDVGKTNKKLFLIDEQYKIVWERTARFSETVDEDGFPCENLLNLNSSVFDALREVGSLRDFRVKAVNFSAYGASFVLLGENGQTLASLYNYLKPLSENISREFYECYGGAAAFCFQTSSPALGNLNSGLQLYRIKKEKPDLFRHIKTALHLPQYMSYLLTGKAYSDMTSIGCHTALWDFKNNRYHDWVHKEGIAQKLAPIMPSGHVERSAFRNEDWLVGIGTHDSSAALIPYLVSFPEPFILISTGTWCISLNPFNHSPLTYSELERDCLCYLTYEGNTVKASRLFAGKEHEEQTARIAAHFNVDASFYRAVAYDTQMIVGLQGASVAVIPDLIRDLLRYEGSSFSRRDLTDFTSPEQAYHQLMLDIIREQYRSTQLVMNNASVKRIFVDGGFSKNPIYMNLLAAAFPNMEVFAASVAQATAIGAALAIHSHWSRKALPGDIIDLRCYSVTHGLMR